METGTYKIFDIQLQGFLFFIVNNIIYPQSTKVLRKSHKIKIHNF